MINIFDKDKLTSTKQVKKMLKFKSNVYIIFDKKIKPITL
jgi:hypothetical protein